MTLKLPNRSSARGLSLSTMRESVGLPGRNVCYCIYIRGPSRGIPRLPAEATGAAWTVFGAQEAIPSRMICPIVFTEATSWGWGPDSSNIVHRQGHLQAERDS